MATIKRCDRCGSEEYVNYSVDSTVSRYGDIDRTFTIDLCESCHTEYLRFIGGQLVEPLPKKEA